MTQMQRIEAYLRIRGDSKGEHERQYERFKLSKEKSEIRVEVAQQKATKFRFKKVFSPECTQEELYKIVGEPVIKSSLLTAQNNLIFTYGMSGTGKSYTIVGSKENKGLLPRVLQDLMIAGVDYISIECIEVYLNKVYDLLNKYEKKEIKLESKRGAVMLRGITRNSISNQGQIDDIIDFYRSRRQTRSTNLNTESSRGHLIFRISFNNSNGQANEIALVDLAGSERAKRTGNGKKGLEEGSKINSSLMVLGRCLNSLVKENIPPFRESNLTRILSNYLTTSCDIKMITTIRLRKEDFTETMGALNFSLAAKKVKHLKIQLLAKKISKAEEEIHLEATCQSDIESTVKKPKRPQIIIADDLQKEALQEIHFLKKLNDKKNSKIREQKIMIKKLKTMIFNLEDHLWFEKTFQAKITKKPTGDDRQKELLQNDDELTKTSLLFSRKNDQSRAAELDALKNTRTLIRKALA